MILVLCSAALCTICLVDMAVNLEMWVDGSLWSQLSQMALAARLRSERVGLVASGTGSRTTDGIDILGS